MIAVLLQLRSARPLLCLFPHVTSHIPDFSTSAQKQTAAQSPNTLPHKRHPLHRIVCPLLDPFVPFPFAPSLSALSVVCAAVHVLPPVDVVVRVVVAVVAVVVLRCPDRNSQ